MRRAAVGALRTRMPDPTPDFAGFPGALRFLRGLARHNERDWFEAHRAEYERDVLQPMRAFVDEMDARLADFAPEFVGDRKRSVFRIHRDVRFSKDKRPYKENAACWLFHRDVGRTKGPYSAVAAAGFYFHLRPGGESFAGGGCWLPPAPGLRAIRAALVEDAEGFARTVRTADFTARFGKLDEDEGAMLTRPPRGFPADGPAAPWLRYRSFTATETYTDAEATAADVADRAERTFRALVPMARWLNDALGHRRAERR